MVSCTTVLLVDYTNGFENLFRLPLLFFANRIVGQLPGQDLTPQEIVTAAVAASSIGSSGYGSFFDLKMFDGIVALARSNGSSPWKLRFPLVMLRMISYNMDRYWASRDQYLSHAEHDAAKEAAKTAAGRPTERSMATNKHAMLYYTPAWYIAYMLYSPLYIAGPIITFNSFVASVRGQGIQLTACEKLVVVLRALFCFLVFETFIHFFYIGAIADTQFYKVLLGDPLKAVQFSLMAVLYLYLKFLVIWRVFRAWSIVDGIYPPENMLQCIICTTSIADFWKGWHSSFNKWLVRYMYIPLGGNMAHLRHRPVVLIASRKLLNVALVFTFVAVWHDQKMNLLAWGGVLIVCMIPEMAAGAIIMLPRFKSFREGPYYRHAQAAGSVFAIYALILANVIGFSAGIEGGQSIYASLADSAWGVGFGAVFYYSMSHFNHLIRQKQRAAAALPAGSAATFPWQFPRT